MEKLNLYYGTLEKFRALGSYDSNALYFVDGVIYKGNTPYSEKISKVSALPETGVQGIIYLLPDYSLYFYNGVSFETISVGVVGTISDDSTENDAKTVSQAAVKAYVAAKTANLATSDNIRTDIATAKQEAIAEAKGYTDTEVADLKSELETTINEKVASVFRFKGTKATYEELEAVADAVVGDVWHVEADSKEYVYTDEGWELLGFTIDLSAYATTDAVTAAINAKAEEIIASINTLSTSMDAKIQAVQDNLDNHAGDATIHITADERAAWNAKATTDQVATAKQEAISEAAADAATKANSALSEAKTYADGLNTAMDTRMTSVEDAIVWKVIE